MTDIEIDQNHTPQKIVDIEKKLGLCEDELILFGKYKAKIDKQFEPRKNSRLILVTAISPTKAGNGKTTVSIGLADALAQQGKSVCALLFANHHSVPCLGSKAAQQAAGIVKLFQWRT